MTDKKLAYIVQAKHMFKLSNDAMVKRENENHIKTNRSIIHYIENKKPSNTNSTIKSEDITCDPKRASVSF